jgi:hypothetical protein
MRNELPIESVTHQETLSMPCIRCFAVEKQHCMDESGRVVGDTHIERMDWAARFYGEFMEKDEG